MARASIDDAAQEVFLIAHRQLPSFEGRSSARTWLAGISLRVASSWRRGERRRGERQPLDLQHPDVRTSPDDSAARVAACALGD